MELTFMEISKAEMKMLIEKRKQAEKQAAIQLEALGGHVYAHRSGKNRYLQMGENMLYNVQAGSWGLDFKV